MTRFTHLILLLLSLAVILRVGLSGSESVVQETAVETAATGESVESPAKMVFNPQVSTPLPDLTEGYLFSQDRFLDESDFDALNSDGKKEEETDIATDLEDVLYSGSLIVGDLRKALLLYPTVQESDDKDPRRSSRRKPRTVMKHEQVDQGATFLGYLVASVEADRIVFEKDGDTVEKLLYDQNKTRTTVPRKASPVAKSPANNPARASQPNNKPVPPKDLAQRRSQRRMKALSGAGLSIPAEKK